MERARKALAAGGSAVRYASRTTGFDFEKWLTWAAVAGVAYVGYKIYSTVSGAADVVSGALNSTGSAIGSGLYDFFHPDQTGEMLFYTVTFPNGERHAIGSREVDSSGRFTYNARRYQIVTKKGTSQKYATPVG